MNNKSIFMITLSFLALICTAAFAQDWKDNWRKSPLTTKNSNEWRNKPYNSKTTNSWRNSPLSDKKSQSKLRSNKREWQKSPTYWRNNPNTKKPLTSDQWNNRWDKRKWKNNPLNWRNSELGYKNNVRKYEEKSVTQEVREWVPPELESEEAPVQEEKKEYAKPLIITITEETETNSQKALTDTGYNDNSITVIDGRQIFKLGKNVQKTTHLAPGGLIEIYSSNAESR